MLTVCALYKFATLEDYEQMQNPLRQLMDDLTIKGTILLAKEGINGTIAGTDEAIQSLLKHLQSDDRLKHLEYKFSYNQTPPFRRLKVKLKKEIVTLGVSDIDPKNSAGTYLNPNEWNTLISDPEVVLIDTRNDYEYDIGTFKRSINPNTQTFRQFPQYTKNHLEQYRGKKIAMFCTGGIRCEKSTAYLKSQGFKDVYHLKGGILKYLEQMPKDKSLWQGECFVFDDRVAVKHNLAQGQYDQCHACRYPITDKDKQHQHYEKGVSCARCFGTKNKTQIARYKERQHQMQLSALRGEAHIGDEAYQLLKQKQVEKITENHTSRAHIKKAHIKMNDE